MDAKIFILIGITLITKADSTSTFDQSQTGNLNVQFDLKGLHIIALMKGGKEEYVDYDYAYDYSEMTIKPQNGTTPITTPKPLNSTTVSQASNATVTIAPLEQTTVEIKKSTTQISEMEITTKSDPTTVKMVTTKSDPTTTAVKLDTTTESPFLLNENASTSAPMPLNATTQCKKGFIVNQAGECELKLQGTGNALIKLVKLSQKLKLRRENRDSLDTA